MTSATRPIAGPAPAASSLPATTTRSTHPSSPTTAAHPSTAARWAGRVLTGIPVAFLLFDAAIKFTTIKPVSDAMTQLGWPVNLAAPLGALLLSCVILYLVPQTAVFGAVLLTGYLGGAVATHLRVGDPLFSHILFPTYVGAMIWGGLALRDARVRALLPFRSRRA